MARLRDESDASEPERIRTGAVVHLPYRRRIDEIDVALDKRFKRLFGLARASDAYESNTLAREWRDATGAYSRQSRKCAHRFLFGS